ncbi:hypothetical protein PR202_gb01848 [Eleusine coracana subsp. coracana]|uniref:Histidine-containing phosphotransfer protein n=1 Tax=Eleusine coracana subsp. coracana TaxID=191504 RepID=A0AAV5DXJ6_ELECO|nr:hypothetical protein PR202_gb01848 [Eleusine coracana subsp. coracana]
MTGEIQLCSVFKCLSSYPVQSSNEGHAKYLFQLTETIAIDRLGARGIPYCLWDVEVEALQDETSPNFTEEVVSLFFKDSTRLMLNIEQAMEKYPRDFKRWDAHVQQLKGSCSSIGASRMKNECTSFRTSCGAGNVESCTKSLQKVKTEHAALRQKLESYFQVILDSQRRLLYQSLPLLISLRVLTQHGCTQLMRQAGPCGMATRPRGM